MKKICTVALTALLLAAGCSVAPLSGNSKTETDNKTESENKVNPELTNAAAVQLTASVRVLSNQGADTPTDEASEQLKSISSVTVSAFDEKSKLIDVFSLPVTDANIKGEIASYGIDFKAIPKGKTTLKYVFNNKDNQAVFTTETTTEFKAKSLYTVTGELEQESVNTNPDGEVKNQQVLVNEIAEGEYVKGQMNLGLKADLALSDDEVKKLLTDKGIAVTEVKKIGVPGTFNISFSAPDTSAALILAGEIDKFAYAEHNGIATISIF